MIYSAGPCPVCAAFSDAVFVKSRTSPLVFVLCPACGCAWAEPPRESVVDAVQGPERFAPEGLELPSWRDLNAAKMAHLVKEKFDTEDYMGLSEYLAPAPRPGALLP